MSELGYQILESREADFGALTWTFNLQPNQRVAAGDFAIVPADRFGRSMQKLTEAEDILRTLLDGKDVTERAHKFFDPDPLA